MNIFHLAGFSGLLTGLVIVAVIAMAVQDPTGSVKALAGGTDAVTGSLHGLQGKP